MSKAAFNGSLAERHRSSRTSPHRTGCDLTVAYRKGHAVLRPVSSSGRVFLAPFAGKKDFAHAAALMLARTAASRGLRVKQIGEPKLATLAPVGGPNSFGGGSVMLRDLDLETLILAHGSHGSFEEGVCVMEAVAYVAGEDHGDHPKCACPTISDFLRSWNDSLKDDQRQILKPLIPKLVGTNHGPEIALKRSYMVADWLVRTYTPEFLRMAKLEADAEALAALGELKDKESFTAAVAPINTARDSARAAWAAAGDAAWAAAAGAAAGAAARAAAWAAAAGAAARAAAGDAAWAAAAGDAAWAALKPSVERLQLSALDLVERMIAVQPETTVPA
jgi:hypothetical protein